MEHNEECSPTYRVPGHEHFETAGNGWQCWQCATPVSAAVPATPETAPVGTRVWRHKWDDTFSGFRSVGRSHGIVTGYICQGRQLCVDYVKGGSDSAPVAFHTWHVDTHNV